MILVTGATGRIGKELVLRLAADRHRVRAFVRDPERAAALLEPNVTLAIGDAERPDTIATALEGIDRLFLATSAVPQMVELQGAIVEAAARAGVRHIVKLSAWDAAAEAATALGRWHHAVEERIDRSGLAWTHLRAAWFVQNLLDFAPQVGSEHVLAAPAGDGPIAMVDTRDVAAVAATVLASPAEHVGEAYEITGPDAVTFRHLAARLALVTGSEVGYVDLAVEEARRKMQDQGLADWLVEDRLALYASFRAGKAARVTEVVKQITGFEARSADAFLRDHSFTFGA